MRHLQQQQAQSQSHLSAAAFEFAMRDISARQRRCNHVCLLLTAVCALWFIFCACGLACEMLWHVNPAPMMFSVKSLVLSVIFLCAIRLVRRKLALESESVMCGRMNRTLALCNLDLAYDAYSGRLFSARKRAHTDGHPVELVYLS